MDLRQVAEIFGSYQAEHGMQVAPERHEEPPNGVHATRVIPARFPVERGAVRSYPGGRRVGQRRSGMGLECGNALRYEVRRPQVVTRRPHEVLAARTIEYPNEIGGRPDIGLLAFIFDALIAGA